MTGFESGLKNWNSIHSNILRANQGAKQLEQGEKRLKLENRRVATAEALAEPVTAAHEAKKAAGGYKHKAEVDKAMDMANLRKQQQDNLAGRINLPLDAAKKVGGLIEGATDYVRGFSKEGREKESHSSEMESARQTREQKKKEFKDAEERKKKGDDTLDSMRKIAAKARVTDDPEEYARLRREFSDLKWAARKYGVDFTDTESRGSRTLNGGNAAFEEGAKSIKLRNAELKKDKREMREAYLNSHFEDYPAHKKSWGSIQHRMDVIDSVLGGTNVLDPATRKQMVTEHRILEEDKKELEAKGTIIEMVDRRGYDYKRVIGNPDLWQYTRTDLMRDADNNPLQDKDNQPLYHMGLDVPMTFKSVEDYLDRLDAAKEDRTTVTRPLGAATSEDETTTIVKGGQTAEQLLAQAGVGSGEPKVTSTLRTGQQTLADTVRTETSGPPPVLPVSIDELQKFWDVEETQKMEGGFTAGQAQAAEVAAKAAAKDAVNIEMSKGAPNEKDAAAIAKRAQDYKPPDRYETKQKAETEAAGIDETSMGHMRRYIGGSKRELDRMTPIQITKKYRDKQQKGMEKSAGKVSDMVYALLPGHAARVEGKEGGGLDTVRMVDSVANAIRKFDKFDNILPHELGTITVYSKDGKHKEIIDVNWPKDEKTIDKLRPLLEDIGKIKNNIKWADGVLNPPKKAKPPKKKSSGIQVPSGTLEGLKGDLERALKRTRQKMEQKKTDKSHPSRRVTP